MNKCADGVDRNKPLKGTEANVADVVSSGGINTINTSHSVWKTGCPWGWERSRLWRQRVSGAYDWGDRTRQQTLLCIYSENICVSGQCFSPLLAKTPPDNDFIVITPRTLHNMRLLLQFSPFLDFPQIFLCVARHLWLGLCSLWLVQTVCCVARV